MIRVGLAAVLSVLVIAIAAPSSASAAPFSCDAFGYLFQTPGDPVGSPSVVERIDLATGTYNRLPGTTTLNGVGQQVNAAAYNTLDNFFYVYNVTDGTIAQVNDDLTLTTMPTPADFPLSAQADFDSAGHYWAVGANAAGVRSYYEVDYAPGSPTYGQLLSSGPIINQVPAGVRLNPDWSWIDGYFYSFGVDANDVAHLIRFDPATGVERDMGSVGVSLANPQNNVTVGATYADASGFLYGSQNVTGRIFRINPRNLQAIPVANGPAAAGNDGARCKNAPIPTITVTKTVGGRVRPADQFTVGLVKPDGSAATSATTSGTETSVSTTNFPASQGQTYTITDAMAPNSPTPLGEYTKSIACTDANGNAVSAGGSGPTWTLAVAEATNYTCNVTNRAVADLEMAKSAAPSPVVPGEDVTFTLTVTNKGPSTSIGETVTDQLPAEVTFAAASAGCSEAGGTVTCAVGELAPGASKTFTITAGVASSLDKCLRNTGTVTGAFDPDTSNNTSSICTPIEGRSNISITKSASSATVAAGGQVMYTLVVKNEGPSDDPNVTVTDPLPAGLALVSAAPSQGTCTTTNNVVSCELGALKDRGSAQVLVTANLTAAAARCGAGSVTNTAHVQGAHEDPDAANNQASAQICAEIVDPVFDLSSTKTMVTKGKIRVGQKVTYKIVVANKGPDAAPGAKMTDTLNAPAKLVSVNTTAGSCNDSIPVTCSLGTIAAGDSVTITIKVRHREAGKGQTNAASVTGEGKDNVPEDNIDKVTKTVRKVTLKVTKVASSRTVSAGGRVSYTIRVKNTSRGVARNVKTCDRLPSGMAFTSATKKAKKSQGRRCWTAKRLKARQTKSYRVTVRVASGANGRKVNRASVRSRDVRPASARRPVRVLGVATPVTG